MDEFSLIVEGIGNKVKRLILKNKQLKDSMLQVEEEKMILREKINQQEGLIRQLESTLSEVKVAKVLASEGVPKARQKLNDLLREIEKCQALLNR